MSLNKIGKTHVADSERSIESHGTQSHMHA
jgi:hypothetical protein